VGRTWGTVRRPRTVGVLVVLVAVLCAASPAGARVHRVHQSERSLDVARRPHAAPTPGLVAALAEQRPVAAPPPVDRPAHRQVQAAARPTGGTVLYLTFDDGPDPHWTPQVLAILARNHATATFFQIGEQVRAHPQTAAAVRAAGQHVGNHTAHHRRLTGLPGPSLRAEISGGVATAACLRPPFGSVDARVRAAATAAGQQVVLWNVDTEDWARPGVAPIERHLLRDVRPGRTVLLHDGGGNRAQTLTALAAVLPKLAARGYRFEAVPGC
jgi:peptidoglycan-N-acetylglucosamine deacetylase